MAVAFPPEPAYPLGLDSNRTLFLVFNTSEAVLSSDNSPWSEEIEIRPVSADAAEQWSENGFANISGELFYYDEVDKNSNGKIYKLKRCARNIGGTQTKSNKAGVYVRGFIIAEHHNQIVESIYRTEKFIGEICTDITGATVTRITSTGVCDIGEETLTCTLGALEDESTCLDDAACPDIVLEFRIVTESSSNCEGTVTFFNLIINGNFSRFRIDFGDGTFTTTDQSGTHVFPPGTNIDPIVTVENDTCQIVQSPIQRQNPEEPPSEELNTPFEIPIPEIPPFPDIGIPDVEAPSTLLTLPQIVFPCLDIGPIGPISIPSIIIVDPPIPSIIFFGPAPELSPISFGPAPSFSPIAFGPAPSFSPIAFGPAPSFSPISFGPAPELSPISFGPAPSFSPIAFGPAPSFSPIAFGPAPSFSPIEVFTDIPSVISIEIQSPSIVDALISVSIVIDDIPSLINVIDDIPSIINLIGDIPSIITLIGEIPSIITLIGEIPSIISLIGEIPSFISLIGEIPSFISLIGDIPSMIIVMDDIPSIITVMDDIYLPPTITLTGDIPPSISIIWGDVPSPTITWGTPPECNCTVSVVCPGTSMTAMAQARSLAAANSLNDNFLDAFNDDIIKTESLDLGIPSEIKVMMPDMPDLHIRHDIPSFINLIVPHIPDINIRLPDEGIPREIRIVNDTYIPKTIAIIADNIPQSIKLESDNIPSIIHLIIPDNFPKSISIDASGIPDKIQVVGIPESIELKGHIPSEITIKAPENLEIPLVYKGGPIPIQFNMDNLIGANGEDMPCFAIVPCPTRK